MELGNTTPSTSKWMARVTTCPGVQFSSSGIGRWPHSWRASRIRERLPNEYTSSRGVEQAASGRPTRKEVNNMFELTTGADALGLQSVADLAELHRRHGARSYR